MDKHEGQLMQAISFQAVTESQYPAVVRVAAAKLMAREYYDVGTFLRELPEPDLAELNARGARVVASTDTAEDFDSLLLLSCMLAQAEGGALNDVPPENRASNLIILLTLEDLERKGIIEFYREKATLCNKSLEVDIAHVK